MTKVMQNFGGANKVYYGRYARRISVKDTKKIMKLSPDR